VGLRAKVQVPSGRLGPAITAPGYQHDGDHNRRDQTHHHADSGEILEAGHGDHETRSKASQATGGGHAKVGQALDPDTVGTIEGSY
jgi:hypothetical protein